ncbi:MAG: Sapep family Mn(2+)-dependent dipeptidase [Clostridia bacterium]|nr:Sapep family Mn(2+)-dependent dipeptidase [Clostridia bacterium]
MQNFNEFIKDLGELIAIKSVQRKAEKDAPFGTDVKNALLWFLKKAESFGFKTINYDNYAGEIVYGNGQEVGIIGHLDVVPVANDWHYPPFALTKKDGYYIGRGVGDDKGAMLLTLYALKELKDSGTVCNKKIRFFVGTNEESGWEDVKYLKTKTTLPKYGFSPDGNFPVSYAEKGFYYVKANIPPFKNFGAITGGTVINAVCAKASVRPKGEFDKTLLAKYGLTYNSGEIISLGVAAHGSQPSLGKNAILPLLRFLKDSGEDVGDFIDYLFLDKWEICSMKNAQGYVTFSPNLVKENIDGGTEISCDMRIPAPFTVDAVKEKMKNCPLDITVIDHEHPPVMTEKDGKFVQVLLKAYNETTSEKLAPVSMGGSTFARVFLKGCAFGPEFPNVNFHLHEADERVKEEHLLTAYDIYKKALFDLAALKEDL